MTDIKLLSFSDDGCEERAERGKRGHRGPTGPTGPAFGPLGLLTLTPPVTGAIGGGDNADFSPAGGETSSVWRLVAGGIAGGTITGIALAGGNPDGRLLFISNISAGPGVHNISFTSEDVGSLAANRILTANGATFTVPHGGTATLIYDGTSERWRLLGVVTTTLPLTDVSSASLDVSGDLFGFGVIQGQATSASAAGTQNDYNPGGHWPKNQNVFVGAGAALVITGFDATDVDNGQTFTFVNTSPTNSVTFDHDNSGSLAANRLFLPSNTNFTLPPNGAVQFVYTFSSVWQLIG